MYSYLEGFGSSRKWFIEFHYLGMAHVTVEYDSGEKWESVLKELKKYII